MTGPGEVRLCEGCGESNPARARFCLGCGSPLSGDSAGERRTVTVVFADLSGFTAYSEESDVEDVRAIAQETAGRLGEIVERYGGTVDKIIGDCVMAVFGAPVAHEDDPERAVRAALDMQACVTENQDRFAGLTLCVGMLTGEAMWSPVGSDGRYTVLGDTVNTAARLQGAAGKGEIYIGLATYNAVAEVIECEPLEPIKAKNKAEPVPAWKAIAVIREAVKHKPVRARLAGREAELNRLEEMWGLARTLRQPHGVTVIGSPGVGKTRLVSALSDAIGGSGLVLRGRCLPYGEGITYWPVIEAIEQVAQIRHDDDQETVSRKLGALLESLHSDDLDELRTMAVALANLIGAPTTPRGTYSATEISRGELHWGLRRILELAARIQPIVLVFEDLHWAEPTLLDLIEFIFESRDDAPILGIACARPEFTEIGGNLLIATANRRIIELDALSVAAARDIVAELLGGREISEERMQEVLASAGGNPLFLEEIVQMWQESDGSSLDGAEIPTGLRSLIDSRLDRLSDAERRLASRAAVIGDVFWEGTIRFLSGGEDVTSVLDSLASRDLIRAQRSSSVTCEHEYAFKHGLIRDAAYARLAKAERATLHQRCGDWISELPGGTQEFAEIIAYHLEQACILAADLSLADAPPPLLPAARALMSASEKAEAREGLAEAERFLARAVHLLADRFPETAIELRLKRARILAGLGRFDDCDEQLKTVVADAGELGRADLRCRALITLAEVAVSMGNGSDASQYLDQAEELARETRDPSLRVRASWIRAAVHEFFSADVDAAIDTLQGAIALSEEIDDPELVLTGRMRLGALHYNRGDLTQAKRQFERCLELAREQGGLRHQAWVTAFLGLLHQHCGPREQADESFALACDWFERTNDRYMLIQTLMWRGALALTRDDVGSAIKILREAQRLVSDFGGALAVNVFRLLTEALARQGRVAEAREVADAARSEAPDEDAFAQAAVWVADAFAAHASGDNADARRHFAQALPILEKQGAQVDLADARLGFARLLEAAGDVVSASDQLESARDLYDRAGAQASVAYVDSWMARLRDAEMSATRREEPVS